MKLNMLIASDTKKAMTMPVRPPTAAPSDLSSMPAPSMPSPGPVPVAPSAAPAHFILQQPASWLVESPLGDPQKAGPCGGTTADPGTPTQDLGKLVRVVSLGHDWSFAGDSRLHWCCDTLGQRMAVCLPDGRFWGLSSGREQIEFPDLHLRPIRGDGLAESDDIETPKHVEDATA